MPELLLFFSFLSRSGLSIRHGQHGGGAGLGRNLDGDSSGRDVSKMADVFLEQSLEGELHD